MPILAAKLEVLKFIDEHEVIGPLDLMNYFGLSRSGAGNRLYRLQKAGLIEPLSTERGQWVLSVKGHNHLEFLRRREDEQRRRIKTGSTRG